MSILASGITFKVRLDVEGAKADLAGARAAEEKTEAAVRRPRRNVQGGEERGGLEKYFSMGAGGMGINYAAFLGEGAIAKAVQTTVKAGLVTTAIAGTAYVVDYAFEHGAPIKYAQAEGMLAGTVGEGLAAASRRDAESRAKDVARHRAEITQVYPAYERANDYFENVALLGGKPPTWSRKAYVEKEQYEMAKYREQMDSLKERMREQITKRFWARYTTGILGEAVKGVVSMW